MLDCDLCKKQRNIDLLIQTEIKVWHEERVSDSSRELRPDKSIELSDSWIETINRNSWPGSRRHRRDVWPPVTPAYHSSVLNYPRPMKSGWSTISWHGYRSFDPSLDYIDLAAWYLPADRLNQPSPAQRLPRRSCNITPWNFVGPCETFLCLLETNIPHGEFFEPRGLVKLR